MVSMRIRYDGGLRCTANHGPSGSELQTDAPVDNHGRGETFSPTDLLATSLGACMLTVMGIAAEQHGWRLDGLGVQVDKHMTASPPRKVARLVVTFEVPEAIRTSLDAEAKRILEDRAHNCPVRLSIAEHIDVSVTFGW